jgi:predicted GH43/DUF377 family glycosyl hydrolase
MALKMQHFETRLKNYDNTYKDLFVRHQSNPILSAKDWPYPVNTVFNPAVTLFQNKVLLLARVEDRRGFSHLTKAVSKNGIVNWIIDTQPTFEPDSENYPEETWGVEDPRITRIDELDKWAITYTAYSSSGPMVSLALTKNFVDFERIGSILLPEDKDAALFPRRIGGKWMLIHRPAAVSKLPGTHVWASSSVDLKNWSDRKILIPARTGAWWDANKVGLSAQPLETPDGWLILYHGLKQTAAGAIYRLGLALLDLDNPFKILRRSDEWIFGPQKDYEKEGDVGGAVFPCGWILDHETGLIRMYYGAADTCIALATANLNDLLEYIKSCPEAEQEI